MAKHSKLPPSSAGRRVACPGSRALEEKYPENEESPHALEGHAAHWVASSYLYSQIMDMEPEWWRRTNAKTPNGEIITSEMYEGAELYVDHIFQVGEITEDGPGLHIEQRIDIPTIHPDCWGTPDCWLYTGSELHIWDYKFGHGFVEVFENWQLMEYAAGILDKLQVDGIADQHLWVSLHIVQPRSYNRSGPIRTWRIHASTLRPYFNILRRKELEAAEEYALCTPNPECSYCTGRHACEALQRSSLSAVDASVMNIALQLPPEQTGNELRYLRHAAALLDARITGLTEEATAMISRGDRVPFFKLEKGNGRDRWKKEPNEIIAMGELLGHNLAKPAEVITPKQAIKLGLPEDVINSYYEKTHGSMKLIEDDGQEAKKLFGVDK